MCACVGLGETGVPWDMGYLETDLFDTEIIMRFVRHLVNGTKTNQFPFSTPLLMADGHLWHVCKLKYIFLHKKFFLGMINIWFYKSHSTWFPYDFGGILHLCYHFITYILWFASNTPHTQTMIYVRPVSVGHLKRCLNVPQNCLKVPQVCLKVSRKCLKVPPHRPYYYCNICIIANCRL